jgi:hypothetical protein
MKGELDITLLTHPRHFIIECVEKITVNLSKVLYLMLCDVIENSRFKVSCYNYN